MMQTGALHLRNVTLVDHQHPRNGEQLDIRIEEGVITAVDRDIPVAGARRIEAPNLHVSPGWFDLRAHFCDPGEEHKENIETGLKAAARGGYTGVALSPDTLPCVDRKTDVEYLLHGWEDFPVKLYPIAALTKNQEGRELTEMYDLYQAGAAGFAQGHRPLENSAVLKLALQYAREFAPPLHLSPYDPALRQNGQMHEGAQSALLGLKGIPELAEETAILQALHLAEYAETTIHLTGISGQRSLALLGRAGYQDRATADVNWANLLFCDEDLQDYDSRFKVFPPLRSAEDREALWQALANGHLQAIASQHQPQAVEDKRCEFEIAGWGMATLELVFGGLGQANRGRLPLDRLIALLSHGPRAILELEQPQIQPGNTAELTLFNPALEWSFSAAQQESLAANYPPLPGPLRGKPLGIINGAAALLQAPL